MRCLVLVKFLPGGSLPPEEFFARLDAQLSWIEGNDDTGSSTAKGKAATPRSGQARSAVGIANYESVEQLAIDLAIMPGAGISNVEVVPIPQETEDRGSSASVVAKGNGGQWGWTR